jgi:hypothetical protein
MNDEMSNERFDVHRFEPFIGIERV